MGRARVKTQMRRVREVEEDQRKEGGGETKKRKRRAAYKK